MHIASIRGDRKRGRCYRPNQHQEEKGLVMWTLLFAILIVAYIAFEIGIAIGNTFGFDAGWNAAFDSYQNEKVNMPDIEAIRPYVREIARGRR